MIQEPGIVYSVMFINTTRLSVGGNLSALNNTQYGLIISRCVVEILKKKIPRLIELMEPLAVFNKIPRLSAS